MTPYTEREREKLEVLDGSRAGRKEGAAVRIRDIAAILQIQQLQSKKAAGEAPTQAEFDALVDDVAKLHARLKEVSDALGTRLR